MEAMFAQHSPLVYGQSVGCQIYNPGPRLRRPCSLPLTHSISLSAREKLPTESESHHKTFSSNVAVNSGANAGRCDSSPSSQFHPQSHNLFLPETELSKDDEDEWDGDKYCEDSFFHLHGDLKGTPGNIMGVNTGSWPHFSSQCTSTEYNPNLKVLHQALDCSETQILGLQHHRDSRETPILMDCEEKDWGDDNFYEYRVSSGNIGGFAHGKASSDCGSSSQDQNDYISDSSCSSSDGVLVNFSAIYNKTNNAVPATPYDLDSPAMKSTSQDDNTIPYGAPCRVDPNCNVCQMDSNSLSSLEISDLTNLENRGLLLASTNSYYKLVRCDLLSQSPTSPVWSTRTSCSESCSQRSSTPPAEYFLFRKPECEQHEVVNVNQQELQADWNTELQRNKKNIRTLSKGKVERKVHTQMHQTDCGDLELKTHEDNDSTKKILQHVECSPSQPVTSSATPKPPKISFAERVRYKKSDEASKNCREGSTCFQNQEKPLNQKKASQSSESCGSPSTGASSLEVMYYSKSQCPTSLPIQPFVLQPPSGNQSSKILGSLLDQYMSHKHEKLSMSNCNRLTRQLRPSPLGSYSYMHLEEEASSTDTCSSCTPTPVQPHVRLHLAPPSPLFFHPKTRSSQEYRVSKIPNTDQTNQKVMTCHEQAFVKVNFSDEIRSVQTSPALLHQKQRSQQDGCSRSSHYLIDWFWAKTSMCLRRSSLQDFKCFQKSTLYESTEYTRVS